MPLEPLIDSLKLKKLSSVKIAEKENSHPIYGTTIYIGRTPLKTIYGEMTAYAFQDLIHKGYIVALAHGDINAPVLYTRLHSSCVTSQLMRSLDCDCKQQLNGAIKKICAGNGILFYLIQQGRGCGYVGKSRACMNVQYYEQKRNINTFEAYEMLGMQHDYRQYTDVKDILKILGINPQFILLTNNPEKIQKFTKLGIKLTKVQSIQIQPNPFNQTYLVSKQKYGHILFQTKVKVQKYEIPYKRIQPFAPYSLPHAERFVHVSSYYLPLKPVWNHVLLSPEQYNSIFKSKNINKSYQIVRDPARKNEYSYYTELTEEEIKENPEYFSKPNWFQINVHFDIVTHYDYLVLKYGDCSEPNKVPIVRIHSQSLLNRFPLTDHEYEDRYKRSLDLIIRNGCGLIVIFYNDGRGAGFGYFVLNYAKQSMEQQKLIGVQEDKRDYFGAIKLMKHYLHPDNQVDVLTGESSFQMLSKQFFKSNVKVRKYIKLSNESQRQGIHSVQQRLRSLRQAVQFMLHHLHVDSMQKVCKKMCGFMKRGKKIYSTGIGSSQAHSKCLQSFFKHKIQHINPLCLSEINPQQDLLIIFSQNLSPNIICCLGQLKYKNIILVTSANGEQNAISKKKTQFLQRVKENDALFVNYPRQSPDNTLVRISGPMMGYCLISLMKRLCQLEGELTQQSITKDIKEFTHMYSSQPYFIISDKFIESITRTKNMLICCDYPAIQLVDNMRMKMTQGAMINTHVVDYINFVHGTYQFIQNTQDYCVWFVTKDDNKLHRKTVEMLSLPNEMSFTTFYEKPQWLPIQLEYQANNCLLQLIQILKVNQVEWPGKARQNILYDVYQ